MAQPRSSLFDNVDPALVQLIQSMQYDPYQVRPTSGYRPGDPRQHGQRTAMDIELVDPKTGAALENYQDPNTFGSYQQYANALYQHALQTNPELAAKLRWGGYFSGPKGKYGALDLMHFDVGGGAMGGGSWEGGLNPDQAALWGLQSGGGVGGAGGGQMGPPANTQVQDYTPQQRRDAIASIESAGSGDYSALGPVVNRQGDRAYGRYQIMASNIPSWSKEVLGREVTVQEFLADPKIQDAIFDKKFGGYVQKYGERGAAQAWFGGEGNVGKEGAEDILGTNVGGYGDRYLKALGGAPGGAASTPGGATTQPGGSQYVSPEAQTAGTVDPKKAEQDRLKTIGDKMFGNLGDLAGGGTGPSPLPTSTIPKMGATRLQGMPGMAAGDTSAQDALRADLAQRIARLNSGKLF